MSEYVDGEEEQLALLEHLVRDAQREYTRLAKGPVPDRVTQLLRGLARESFRRGFQHAHTRKTVKEDLWPEQEDEK